MQKLTSHLEACTKEIKIDDVPCGKCLTTRYVDAEGNVVREDVEIQVDAAFLAKAFAGG